MTKYEKQKISAMVKGMSAEELTAMVSVIPSKPMFIELFSRLLSSERTIAELKELIARYEEL